MANNAIPMAIIHDWLTGMRGGEKCLKIFCEIFPQSDLFTLFHKKEPIDATIWAHSLEASLLQGLPGIERYYRYLLPLFPFAIEGFDLTTYPLILSISHCVAKGIIPGPQAFHVCYCLTPMRYIWDMYPLYFGGKGPGGLPRGVPRLASHYLRMWDVAASSRVDAFVAISDYVAARIKKYYRREAQVIYPPVEWHQFRPDDSARKDYYLIVAAESQYKRLDIALEAFSRDNRFLKVAGRPSGDLKKRWQNNSTGNIEWLGWVSDRELGDLYANCRALIYPGPEDFGLVPVEVQASGRPVIAFGQGGILESTRGIFVQDVPQVSRDAGQKGYTGLFFSEPTSTSLLQAIACFESIEGWFDPGTIRQWAKQFDRQVFIERWQGFLKDNLPVQLKSH